MRDVIFWLARTELATFVRHSAWAVLEIVHVLIAGRMEAFFKPLRQ